MISLKKSYTLLIALLLFGSVSCVRQPEFLYIENVEINGVNKDTLFASLNYVVYNPSKSKVELVNSEMNIYYKEALVGMASLDSLTKMVPKDTMSLPVNLNVSLKELANNYAELLAQDSSLFVVKGQNEVNFIIDGISISTEEEIYMRTKEVLMSQISGQVDNSNHFKLKSVGFNRPKGFRETEFDITMEFQNSLPIDFFINKMDLTFYFDKESQKVSDWVLKEPIEVNSQAFEEVKAKVVTDNLSFLKGFNPKWISGKADFIMKGTIEIEIQGYTFELPIEDEQTIDIRDLLRSR